MYKLFRIVEFTKMKEECPSFSHLAQVASSIWWDMDFVSWRNPAVSNSLAWGYNFFVYGHRCGACHNASDAQVRNKRIQYAKIKNVNDSSLLDISLLWSVFLLPSLVAARGRLYMLFWVLAVVIGIYSFG